MRKLLLFFAMLCVSIGAWAYSASFNYDEGKSVVFSDSGSDTQVISVGAGGLAEWFNNAGATQHDYLNSTTRTNLVITGTLNADDIAAIKTYFTPFTTVDMEGVTLQEGASVKGMQLPNAEYIALPHGTPIADMKTLKSESGCPKLKAVAATNAETPTEFTGYSWAAGEIYNICQKGLVDGINSGVCANTMEKLTIGGTVDDRDVSTAAATSSDQNKNWTFAQGDTGIQYQTNGVAQSVTTDYLKPTHNEQACSPWGGGAEISLDFTEAIFSNFGDLAAVSPNVTELLLPTDPNFTVIKPFMFAGLTKLQHIIIPNNIVTIGDAAYYVNDTSSELTEISIGNGVKTIGNLAFAARGRQYLEDVRFAAGIDDVKILANVFSGCSGIKHLALPEGVVSLGESCFEALVSLESVHFPTTLEYIGKNCFARTGLTSLTIPKHVKIIDYNAFALCRITDIYLMAENVNQIPYIFAQKSDYINAGSTSTFGSMSLNGNNTTPQLSTKDRTTEAIASKEPYDAEEFFRLSVKDGNTIARLHYNEGVENFINLNPWYVPGQTTPKPISSSLIGTANDNGGINESQGLSDTFYFIDSENNTYPSLNANDLARPSWAAYFSGNNHTWAATVEKTDDNYNYALKAADYSLEDGSSLQTQYYDPVTGNLISFTEVTTHMWNVLRKEGWRQFTFRAGDAGSEDIVFNKSYENIWYTMCFPFSLTDEQLETAFNAEYNIADFSGVEVKEENKNGNREIILHFNTIGKAKYFDLQHNEYQRVGSGTIKQMGQSKFKIYTYTKDGDNYEYVETYSNKSYAKNGDKSNGIVYIDGYLAQAGHPYMIHPNLGTKQGDDPVVAHMVGINYYSKDPIEIDKLCKDRARSIDLGTGMGYEGVTYSLGDASDIAVKTDNEITENFQQAAYSNYTGQTYSFVGNCNEYTADAPAEPTVANGGLEALPNIEDYVDAKYLPNGPVKAVKGDAPSSAEIEATYGPRKSETDAPNHVDNPNYGDAFEALYNKEFSYYPNGQETKTTFGDAFVNHSDELITPMQLLQDWGDTYGTGNADLASYLGVGTYVGFSKTLITDLINKCNTYKAYNDYLVVLKEYNDNVEAWAAYDAAYSAWANFNEEQAEADYQAALVEYGTQMGAYSGELSRVQNANDGKLAQWRNDVKAYAVYIPENAYFLSRNSGEYYPHFFREKASLATRKTKGTGKWTRYSAVLIPNSAALSGVEVAQDPAASKAFNMVFDESFTAVEPTAIEQIVEDAKEKGQSVQYIDVVVSIDGKVVRRGDTSLEGLPSGIYIINGKKYFVK